MEKDVRESIEEAQKLEREANLLKAKARLYKPDLKGFVAISLRSGKIRKIKVGEFKPLIVDHSDPSPEDGDIILPKKKAIRYDKKP
jgi:hypothetical protein